MSQPGRGDLFKADCPTRILMDRIGSKWVSMAIALLAESHPDERGFAELARGMPGVSHKMLSTTLKGLVRDRLVERRVEEDLPALHRGQADAANKRISATPS